MKKLILSLCLMAGMIPVIAQKQYFIYFQSESNEPFYVRMGERTYSSTASGYLILGKIPDSTLNIRLGFANERAPEQVYAIAVKRRDHGFLIKHFGEKGWGLFDLQDLSVQMSANTHKTSSSGKASVINTSMFAEILARASDDPSLKEILVRTPDLATKKPEKELKDVSINNAVKHEKSGETSKSTVANVTETEKVKPDENASQKKIPDPGNTSSNGAIAVVNKENAKENVEGKTSTGPLTTKLAEKMRDDEKPTNTRAADSKPASSEMTANTKQKEPEKVSEAPKENADPGIKKAEKDDTIAEKKEPGVNNLENETPKTARPESITRKVPDQTVAEEKPYKRSVVTKKSESSTTQGLGVVYVDAYADGTKDTVRIEIPENKPIVAAVKVEPKEEKKFLEISSEKNAVDTIAVKTGITNTCNYTANNNDFFKLRKDMAAAKGDEAMLALAKKYFKLKCYTVNQVKSLGSLFLEDEGKYQFYDAVYRHTIDPVNFGTLESELKDAYYVNRFRAMLRN